MENLPTTLSTKLDAITLASALPYAQQFGLVALVILVAWRISAPITSRFHRAQLDDEATILKKVVSLLSPLIWPVIAYGLLHLLHYVQTHFMNFQRILPYRTGKLIVAWLIIRLVTILAH